MARYDARFRQGADASPWWGEGRDFAWGETRAPNVFWGRGEGYGGTGGGGYDRGVYGGSHPAYGGYPGARDGGMYYGGDPGDGEVKREILHRLYGDQWVDADRIRVDVDGGVVVLQGEVDSMEEARYAWEDAWDAPGVHAVVNNLRVRRDVPADAHDPYRVRTTRHWR